MFIMLEPRDDHADALQHLAELSASSDTRGTFTTISRWPALERKALEPYDVPDLDRRDDWNRRIVEPADGIIRAWRATTAVAAGDRIIFMHTLVHPAADPKLADEALAMGRTFALAGGDAGAAANDVQKLTSGAFDPPEMTFTSSAKTSSGEPARKTTTGQPVALSGSVGEAEAAVSGNGQNIVVTGQCLPYHSTNGGTSFSSRTLPSSAANDGDCSVTWGKAGNFYIARLGPQKIFAFRSTDGATFQAPTTVVTRSGVNQRVDQPHVAADRRNSDTVNGAAKDFVYVVWRDSTQFRPYITCSRDSGATWRTSIPATDLASGYPRVAVGYDGAVYVVAPTGATIGIDKFDQCPASGTLVRVKGFPRQMSIGRVINCPVAGLDRCNSGNTLASAMLAADDTDASRVFLAFALQNEGKAGSNIGVIASTNGGKQFGSNGALANAGGDAVRFLPWIAVASGVVHVAWYDRRNATTTVPSLTSYYRNSLTFANNTLTAGTETKINGTDDNQCSSGFPCGVRSQADLTSCPGQTNAFYCVNSAGTRTGARCDPRAPTTGTSCAAGTTCKAGRGCPKYGDYNGLAAGGGKLVNVWATGTPPGGTSQRHPSLMVTVTTP